MEFWYDPRHTGALRVISGTQISGSDPSEKLWVVQTRVLDDNSIEVDFRTKKTHHGKKIMKAIYKKRRSELHWPDGNVWLRMRVDPRWVLQ